MNGERRPEAKLGLRHVQHPSNDRECEQGNRVQHKDGSERDGNLFLAGAGDGGNRGNGAAAADGRAGRDEKRDSLPDAQKSTQPPAQEQGKADAGRGIDESGAARLHHLLQIHAEPEADHGSLQKQF